MVSISLSHDNQNYTSTFSNGQPFTSIVEKGSFSVTEGFSFGSIKTQTCKCTASAIPAYVEELCSYQYIKVYKDNVLAYTGKLQSTKTTIDTKDYRSCSLVYDDLSCDWKDKQFMPIISETDPHRVVNYNGGNIENDILYTQAQITELETAIPIVTALPQMEYMRATLYKQLAELRKQLADLEEQKDGVVTWLLEYFDSDGIKVCDPSDTSHSLLHIIYGYLTNMTLDCTYSDLTPVQYFRAVGTDKVLDTFSNFLKQNSLYAYVTNSTMHIGDLLTEASTATTITNIESGASVSERPYIDRRTPNIRYLNLVEEYTDVELYRLSDTGSKIKVNGKASYPEDSATINTTINGQQVKVSKQTVNHTRLDYPHGPNQEIVKITNTTYECTGRNKISFFSALDAGKQIEVIQATQNGLYFDWKLYNPTFKKLHFENFIINGNVVMTNYNSLTHSDNPNGDEEKCPYIYTEAGSIRYLKALSYGKEIDAKFYDFYTQQDIPVGSFVAINNVTPSGGALLITQKTDAMTDEGGYTYRAVDAYETKDIAYDSTFIASYNEIPETSDDFQLSATRTVVECYSNRTPVDPTTIRVTITPTASLKTPTMTVADEPVELVQDYISVIEEDVEKIQPIQQWHYDIDPNLNGYDSLLIQATLGTTTRELTLLKNVPNDSIAPDIPVPSGQVLWTQYCYGNENGPVPRWVADASYNLEDATDLVADIWWQDEVNGECPLRPRSGFYIWRRQGTSASTSIEPTNWTISLYDTPYYRFDFTTSADTYVKNDRSVSTGENVIYIYPNIVGYDTASLTVTASNISGYLPYDSTNMRYTLAFDANGAPANGVTITATLGAKTWSFKLACDDQTAGAMNLGAISAFPQDYVPIEGDYFVASTAFSTFTQASPYLYNGTSWEPMAVNSANAEKLLNLVSSATSSGLTITQGNGLWTWCENFISQNALIKNLFAQNITILDNGCIHSEYYNDDGTPNLTVSASTDSERMTVEGVSEEVWFNSVGYIAGNFSWEVVGTHPWGADLDPIEGNPLSAGTDAELWDKYGISLDDARQAYSGDIVTVTVSSATGAMSGFWLGANGVLKCQSAEARNLIISGDSSFQGTLSCDVIKTVKGGARITGTYSAGASVSQAKSLINAFPSEVRPSYPSGGTSSLTYNWSDFLSVQMTTPLGASSDIAYVRLRRANFRGTLLDDILFYDNSRTLLDIRSYFTCSGTNSYLNSRTVDGTVTSGNYATTTVTINTTVNKNILQVDIPDNNSGLSKGQLYYDQSTGIVKIQMT